MRRSHDSGEGALGYLAVILLVAAITAVVSVKVVGATTSTGISGAICKVFRDDCGPKRPAASDLPSGVPTPTPGASSPTTRDAGVPAGDPELAAALDAHEKAQREGRPVEDEWANFSLLEELKKLGMDFLFGDIQKCIQKPSFGDCLWALVSVVPWGKVGKLLKTIPKLVKLGDRFFDLKRRLDAARKAKADAKRRLDDLVKKKRDEPKKKPPSCPIPKRAAPNNYHAEPLTMAAPMALAVGHRTYVVQAAAAAAVRGPDDDPCVPKGNNRSKEEQQLEVDAARKRGVQPVTLGPGAGMDELRRALPEGVTDFKWALVPDGRGGTQLKVMPAMWKSSGPGDHPSIELAHTVLAGVDGKVLSAGSGNFMGDMVFINNHSGHFLPGAGRLPRGEQAFGDAGIDVIAIAVPNS